MVKNGTVQGLGTQLDFPRNEPIHTALASMRQLVTVDEIFADFRRYVAESTAGTLQKVAERPPAPGRGWKLDATTASR